jgi:hypothetical protein
MFVGPFVLGLVIIIFIWMFLCCCCCCPSCCPSKCCQKAENESYTKCELIWPTVTLVLAFLLIVVMSVIGITKAADAETAYKGMSCSIAICMDDLINGNVTTTGRLFIGLTPLMGQLQDLKDTYIASITTALDSVDDDAGTATKQANDQGVTLLDDISKIPTGTAGSAMSAFTYNNFDGTSGTIDSTFPGTLGSVSGTDGKIYSAYEAVFTVNFKINLIMVAASRFRDNVGSFNSAVDGAISALGTVRDSMNDANDLVYSPLSKGK